MFQQNIQNHNTVNTVGLKTYQKLFSVKGYEKVLQRGEVRVSIDTFCQELIQEYYDLNLINTEEYTYYVQRLLDKKIPTNYIITKIFNYVVEPNHKFKDAYFLDLEGDGNYNRFETKEFINHYSHPPSLPESETKTPFSFWLGYPNEEDGIWFMNIHTLNNIELVVGISGLGNCNYVVENDLGRFLKDNYKKIKKIILFGVGENLKKTRTGIQSWSDWIFLYNLKDDFLLRTFMVSLESGECLRRMNIGEIYSNNILDAIDKLPDHTLSFKDFV